MLLLVLLFSLGLSIQNILTKNDINIVNRNNSKYDIVVTLHNKIYTSTIDNVTISNMPPIIQLYPNILKEALEENIDSESLKIVHIDNQVKLNLIIELNYLRETIEIILQEKTQKTFEDKIDDKLIEMNIKLLNYIDNKKPERHYLQKEDYEDGDDNFMKNFDWSLASQGEKEKFMRLIPKYQFIKIKEPNSNSLKIFTSRVDPLILEINDNKCHIYGWFKIKITGYDLPTIKLPYDFGNKIIYSHSNSAAYYCYKTLIIEGKILKYYHHHKDYRPASSYSSIDSDIPQNQHIEYSYRDFGISSDKDASEINKLLRGIKYKHIDVNFICNINKN